MIPFIFTNGDEDDDDEEEILDYSKKFVSCETSDECYACTGRVTINLKLCQIEEAPNESVADDEIIRLCIHCLQAMYYSPLLSNISYDPVDAFSWMEFEIIAFHPDSRN